MIAALITLCLAGGLVAGVDVVAQDARGAVHEAQIVPVDQSGPLDGLEFHGTIRARGLIGLVRVRGTLAFDGGELVWTAQGDTEGGPYVLSSRDGQAVFVAEYTLETGEQVRWTGAIDGGQVSDVRAVWTRAVGDIVHDLFLPDVVTLDFTPGS